MNIYGYARVSTTDQNLDRQILQLKEIVTDERNIITDKASGSTFDRTGYNSLVGTDINSPLLRKGDLLVITSLDRLGRNYTEIREQWENITHKIGANIRVLDMPLLDTSKSEQNLDGRFIADLVLQILSYTAEKERLNIKRRQSEGIAAAKLAGKKFGRPTAQRPTEWESVINDLDNKRITARAAMERLNLKPTTFYKLLAEYRV